MPRKTMINKLFVFFFFYNRNNIMFVFDYFIRA